MHEQYRLPLPVAVGQGYSEFNHHLAGMVVFLVGLSAILIQVRPRTFGFLRYVWPLSLILLGGYLILYSDPEAWPSGYLSIADSLSDPEVMQHKVFALILTAMGLVELLRMAGVARKPAWSYSFPALATIGALFLIVHKHGAHMRMGSSHDMPGMDMGHMNHTIGDSMVLILYQHIAYIVVGILIALTKLLHDTGRWKPSYAAYVWPSLTCLLGVMLMLYHE